MSLLPLRVTALLLLTAAVLAIPPSAPRQIAYQGRLTDAAGTPLPDGAKSIRFIIWNHATNSAPANEVWNSGVVSVTSTSGLFSVMLGSSPQPALTPALLNDTMRWLGITVGADPEISPRTRLVSVPYAFNAQNAAFADSALFVSDNYVKLKGDTMTGSLSFDNDALGLDMWLDVSTGSGGNVRLLDDGYYSAVLYGDDGYGTLTVYNTFHQGVGYLDGNRDDGGVLQLNQQDGTAGAIFNGGTSTDGSTLSMYSAGGSNTVKLDADIIGNAAAVLPDSAISAAEMWNEPGLAADGAVAVFTLNSTAMLDLATVTITTPAAGYVVVLAKANANLHGTRSMNYGYMQIDETSGGLTVAPYYANFGYDSALTTGNYLYPVYAHRVFYKWAGTYTFRAEAMAYPSNGAGAVTQCNYPMIMATYYPTAYGSVSTVVGSEDRDGFDVAVPEIASGVGVQNPVGLQTAYRVDLRELELKAAKAQTEAERAQRELAEEKLKQQAAAARR